MYKKIFFLTAIALLASHKSIQGMEIVLDEAQTQDFLQASSRLSSVPMDQRNGELALLLKELKYANGNAPLHFVASIGDMPLAFHLLAQGAYKTQTNGQRKTPCDLAVANGHYELAGALLTKAIDENSQLYFTPLHWAAWTGKLSIVERLLAAGAWVDKPDLSRSTALHYAAFSGHTAIVDILLAAGASVTATDLSGNTALHKAAHSSEASITEKLLRAGAEINATEHNGATPLHLACQYPRPMVVQKLLEFGAEIDTCDNWDRTPLHEAAHEGNGVIVDILLAAGAQQRPDRLGETPLKLAENKYAEYAKMGDNSDTSEIRTRYAAVIQRLSTIAQR